ncbi:MAG: D-alanyl-D-alanine carboxypeptidase/D-alanyl-D-alanine-endopeptidase, partial [Planctomycetes bacterium]|nr:D-alanyl-D-alanine carboxypeptidase/D-alanyl-D-alanine-endopeptidase [Planctomycetota bacterium]
MVPSRVHEREQRRGHRRGDAARAGGAAAADALVRPSAGLAVLPLHRAAVQPPRRAPALAGTALPGTRAPPRRGNDVPDPRRVGGRPAGLDAARRRADRRLRAQRLGRRAHAGAAAGRRRSRRGRQGGARQRRRWRWLARQGGTARRPRRGVRRAARRWLRHVRAAAVLVDLPRRRQRARDARRGRGGWRHDLVRAAHGARTPAAARLRRGLRAQCRRGRRRRGDRPAARDADDRGAHPRDRGGVARQGRTRFPTAMSRPATAASCLVLAFVLAACVAPTSRRGEAIPPLRPALDELLGRPELAGGRIGVLVVDPRDGARWCASDDDRGFATASNMKVLSAVVALTTLGPDWRTTTQLRVRGEVVDGALRGDLVLVGRGDPLFAAGPDAAATWDRFAAGLRALGITRVEGRVVGDGAWLGAETLGRGWSWDSLDEDYAAPFGGLCCARNVVTVRVAPGEGAPVATLVPDVLPPPDVRARMLAPGERGALQANRRLGSERIVVSGGLARDAAPATLAVAVTDPAAFAARVLRRELAARGIAVVDGPGARPDAGERIAAVEVSASLREWLTPVLLR